MKHFFVAAGLVVVGLTVALAQGKPTGDADRMVQGGGALPDGWLVRLDSGSTTPDGVQAMLMGGGLHLMTGPAGIYYRPADTKSGSYEVSATFTQLAVADHPEAYGLFIGGSDLTADTQKYTYFLVRQDGKYMVRRRDGAETPTITNWTDNTAVKKTDASTQAANTLSIQVAPDQVRFLVNGTEVASAATSRVDAAGIAGLRINHNLSVQVNDFSIK